MSVTIGKELADYHEFVGMSKILDSSTAECSYKLNCITLFSELLISNIENLLANNCVYQIGLPYCE